MPSIVSELCIAIVAESALNDAATAASVSGDEKGSSSTGSGGVLIRWGAGASTTGAGFSQTTFGDEAAGALNDGGETTSAAIGASFSATGRTTTEALGKTWGAGADEPAERTGEPESLATTICGAAGFWTGAFEDGGSRSSAIMLRIDASISSIEGSCARCARRKASRSRSEEEEIGAFMAYALGP